MFSTARHSASLTLYMMSCSLCWSSLPSDGNLSTCVAISTMTLPGAYGQTCTKYRLLRQAKRCQYDTHSHLIALIRGARSIPAFRRSLRPEKKTGGNENHGYFHESWGGRKINFIRLSIQCCITSLYRLAMYHLNGMLLILFLCIRRASLAMLVIIAPYLSPALIYF